MAKDSPISSGETQRPFQKFEDLVRKLVHVPKREADRVKRRQQVKKP
jgi:hypothetical protein